MNHPDLGIFARTFVRSDAGQVADAVAAAGYRCVQLNLSSIGRPTVPAPAELADIDLGAIGSAFADRGIAVWGVSLTYNTIHPDVELRIRMTENATAMLARVPELGAAFATICTGSRDPDNMWRRHRDNDSRAAWRDLRTTLSALLPVAAAAGVRLGVEPEPGNVIADARRARQLLDELGAEADLIGIVLDPANLVAAEHAPQQKAILDRAAELLGSSVVCLHAKDVAPAGAPTDYVAVGQGLLDYPHILRLRASLPQPVPVIVQDVSEEDAISVGEFLADGLRAAPWPRR